MVSSLVAAGAAAGLTGASGCSSADPVLPTDSNPIIVNQAAPPPISGGTLLITREGAGTAVAADSDRDLVWLVDLGTQAVSKVALQPGDEPGRLVEDDKGRVHVALRGSGSMVTIDLASRSVVERTPVCSAPRGVAFDPTVNVVHVACSGGELVTFSADGGAPLRTIRIADRDLEDVVVQGDSLVVTRLRTAEVLTLDAAGQVMSRQTPPAVSDPSLLGATFTPTVAWRAIPTTFGVTLVHQMAADSAVVISSPGGYGSSGGGGMGCDGSIVKTSVTTFPAGGIAAGTPATPVIMGASVPVDVTVDAFGNFAIASAGSDSVFLVAQSAVQAGTEGCQPGNAIQLPGTPVAVALATAGVVAQVRELNAPDSGPALVILGQDSILQTIKLPGVTRADTGHRLFHHNASSSSALACASCHPQGREDGHIWVFDTEGARRTQTVGGGVLATAPLHWDGSLTDLDDVMHVVFQERMGGAEQGPLHVAAFGDWLNAIPKHPASPTGTAAQIAHGQQLFESPAVGCTTCHDGAHYTDNQTVDVGTGQAFQVPTLIGVAARAPFMHDGCAATLADRFDPAQAKCNGGDTHGKTSQLSTSDVSDLIAFLETL